MPYVRDGLDAHVNEYIDRQVANAFLQFNPLLYFLGLLSQNRAKNVGASARAAMGASPDASSVFGTGRLGQAQMEDVLGTMNHHFRYVLNEPDNGAAVEYGGDTPQATAGEFDEDRFGTAETRWTHFMEPMRIRKHSLEQAKGETAVGSILEETMIPVWERFIKRINQGLWSGTLNAAGQNARVWQQFLGLTHALTKDNVYGRVDRSNSDATNLNPVVVDAAADLATTIVDLDIMRQVNTGGIDAVGDGLASKDPNGVGATLGITDSKTWNELASQSEGRGNIVHGGIKDHFVSGFRYPIIEHDNGWYTWDPNCPAGELYLLNLETWLMEVLRGHNFAWLGFTDKSKSEEGGGYYEWGHFSFQGRLTCRAPWLNCRITNLTVN